MALAHRPQIPVLNMSKGYEVEEVEGDPNLPLPSLTHTRVTVNIGNIQPEPPSTSEVSQGEMRLCVEMAKAGRPARRDRIDVTSGLSRVTLFFARVTVNIGN